MAYTYIFIWVFFFYNCWRFLRSHSSYVCLFVSILYLNANTRLLFIVVESLSNSSGYRVTLKSAWICWKYHAKFRRELRSCALDSYYLRPSIFRVICESRTICRDNVAYINNMSLCETHSAEGLPRPCPPRAFTCLCSVHALHKRILPARQCVHVACLCVYVHPRSECIYAAGISGARPNAIVSNASSV